MYKQTFILLFGALFLLVGISKSGRIEFDDDDDDLLANKLSYPLNRRTSYNLHDFFKRASTFTAAQTQFQKEMLDTHNVYRKRNCVGSLSLDNTLNRQAQDYADKLAATNTFKHSGTKGVGENLWATWSSGKLGTIKGSVPTDDWYNEIKFYNFTNPGFSSKTGHFTQVVWKSSKNLGAGIAYSKDGTQAVVVAQYTPAGNVIGAFSQNVFPANC